MTNQVIPAEAIEAATLKLASLNSDAGDQLTDEEWTRAILEAAAPHMLAEAWRSGFWKGTAWVDSAGEDGSEDARFNNPHDGSTP